MIKFLAILLCAAFFSLVPARAEESAKPVVVATLFPVIDFARTIAGDFADVRPLLPPGAEAHTYSPTPTDMMGLTQARLFLYVSDSMETWAPGLAAGAPPSLLVRAVAPASKACHEDEDEELDHDEDGDSHHHHGLDPHVWLDPLQAQAMVRAIAVALSEADPEHAIVFSVNAQALQNRLQELDTEISAALATCKTRTLICGGHFAFGHFAARYGLQHLSPYSGFSPNAQPSPRALAELVQNMRALGTTALFYEEILDPKLSRVLADETGARLLPLHSMHNITPSDIASGATYFSLMHLNLENIRQGLGCAP